METVYNDISIVVISVVTIAVQRTVFCFVHCFSQCILGLNECLQ